MPRLSIIVPVYNTAQYLNRSIQSIINQTYRDWELILVNDGSQDNSLEICKQFEAVDNRICVIDKENGGAGSARNAGMDVAKGEYFAFPDSDDWLEKDAYKICMEKIDERPVDLLLFGEFTHVTDDETGIILETKKDLIEAHECYSQEECRQLWRGIIMEYHMNAPWNKIYRSAVIRENNLRFPDLRRMQDGVFNLNYYNCIHSFSAIKEYLYHFIWHSSDVQKKKIKSDFLTCSITYFNTALNMVDAWGVKTNDIEKKLGSWFSETLIMAEFKYIPSEINNLFSIYKYVRSINNHKEVKRFFKGYMRIVDRPRKIEWLMYYRNNMILAIYIKLMRFFGKN